MIKSHESKLEIKILRVKPKIKGQSWYKNQMSKDEIEKQNKSNLIQLKEWGSNMIKLINNMLFFDFFYKGNMFFKI